MNALQDRLDIQTPREEKERRVVADNRQKSDAQSELKPTRGRFTKGLTALKRVRSY
jgi:hypothetical protein